MKERVDVNKPGSEGYTPLCIASSRGHVEVVKLLAEMGADINTKAKAPTTVILAGGGALNLTYWRR